MYGDENCGDGSCKGKGRGGQSKQRGKTSVVSELFFFQAEDGIRDLTCPSNIQPLQDLVLASRNFH